MKRISTAMMLIGFVMLIIALNSDVAVDGFGRQRITNDGLMHQQLINTILSISLMLGGLLIKLLGKNVSEDGLLQLVDQLPMNEFVARGATALLASACLWILVVMYFWSTKAAGTLLVGAFVLASFLPQATYMVMKRVWLVVLAVATVVLILHAIAIPTAWINRLTIGLFSEGVYLLDNSRTSVLVGTLVVVPWLVSIRLLKYSPRPRATSSALAHFSRQLSVS